MTNSHYTWTHCTRWPLYSLMIVAIVHILIKMDDYIHILLVVDDVDDIFIKWWDDSATNGNPYLNTKWFNYIINPLNRNLERISNVRCSIKCPIDIIVDEWWWLRWRRRQGDNSVNWNNVHASRWVWRANEYDSTSSMEHRDPTNQLTAKCWTTTTAARE